LHGRILSAQKTYTQHFIRCRQFIYGWDKVVDISNFVHGMLLVPVRNHHTTQYSNDIFTDCLCTIKITITYRKMDAFNIWQCWDTGYPPHLYIFITIKCRNSAKYDYFSIAAILGKPLWIYVCFWLSSDVLLLYMWIEFVGNLQELVGKLMILLHQYLLACWLWFLYVICPILR